MGSERKPDMNGIVAMLLGATGVAGGGSGSVTLNSSTAESSGAGSRTASYRVANDGIVYVGDNGSYSAQYTWTGDSASNYEVRLTQTAGNTVTGDSLATWLALSSTRTWSVADTVADDILKYAYLTVEIRDVATSTVRASASITIYAERTS